MENILTLQTRQVLHGEAWMQKYCLVQELRNYGKAGKAKIAGREEDNMETIIPGWDEAVRRYATNASVEDLSEVVGFLGTLLDNDGKVLEDPVHVAAARGYTKLMEFFTKSSFDFNQHDSFGYSVFQHACWFGRKDIVGKLIDSAKDLSIDLNARTEEGRTGFSLAVAGLADCSVKESLVKMILEHEEGAGIHIRQEDNAGENSLDLVKRKIAGGFEEYGQLQLILEEAYSTKIVS